MILAFIPARGASKRLPRKNLKLLDGHPLISYSIAIAKKVKVIDRCVVSTEDPEIARVALLYGAEVINRPETLADDFATTASVAKHALEQLIKRNEKPDILVTLQPTNPLRPVSLVDKAIELFEYHKNIDSVISVTKSDRKLGLIKDGYFMPDYRVGMRSQDMPAAYFENGLIYVSKPELVINKCDLFGERILPLITEPLYSNGDIDSKLDFEIAEFLFQKYREHFKYEPVCSKE